MLYAGRTGAIELDAFAAQPLEDRRATHVWYRADATITFLGIPIFSRRGVGSGCAVLEAGDSAAGRSRALQFAAGSWPHRTRGLNRLGWMQEIVRERGGEAETAAYFGFMTHSPEKSLEQAKQSTSGGDSHAASYQAVAGAVAPDRLHSSIYGVFLPPEVDWLQNREALRRVREHLASGAKPQRVVDRALHPEECRPQTFLYAVYQAICNAGHTYHTSFVHHGKPYVLDASKSKDAGMTRKLSERGIRTGGPLMRMDGTIHESPAGAKTTFKIWTDPAGESALPLRIEYQARSFLWLTFERDFTLDASAPALLLADAEA
jgi:hypothetical protein